MSVGQLPVAYTLLELTVAVIAVVGNIVVMIAFRLDKRVRKKTNFYIFSLATADLLVGLVGVPSAILTKLGLPEGSFSGCITMLSLLVVLCTISILNLLAVSVDRYWAVLHPFSYRRKFTGRGVIAIILGCWLSGNCIGFSPLFGWNSGSLSSGRCFFTNVMNYDFLVFLYFATIVYPTLLMAFFYAKIYIVVLRQVRQISALEQAPSTYVVSSSFNRDILSSTTVPLQQASSHSKRDISKAKKLSIIVLFFVICWLPLYTINCIQAFCHTCVPPSWLLDCFIVLSHANSAVNPFLYAYHMREFREVANRLICCLRRSQSKKLDLPLDFFITQGLGRTIFRSTLTSDAKNKSIHENKENLSRTPSYLNVKHT
ncbi:adenosine receptor A2b-like [Tachypleus tridentatus]|uniref:adenosine receptor A2b-like n=1 Tax=Tachypleus tridentatus TaxID=6853 RepID=UPI003FCF139E